jgi:Mn-dependent DtxR family transcriptional regulator
MEQIISKADLARHLGVSRPRVSQLIGQGMPARPDGRIDLQAALVWISQHSDRSRNVGRARKPTSVPPSPSPRVYGDAAASPPMMQSGATDPGRVLLIARARKALAETKRFERLEKLASGEVIAASEARRYASEFSHILRDAALSQADRLTENVMAAAAAGDRERVCRAIRDDNHRMLSQVSKSIVRAGLAEPRSRGEE